MSRYVRRQGAESINESQGMSEDATESINECQGMLEDRVLKA